MALRMLPDEDPLWRIDVEHEIRPSKRQRRISAEEPSFPSEGAGNDTAMMDTLEDVESMESLLRSIRNLGCDSILWNEVFEEIWKRLTNETTAMSHKMDFLNLGGHWMLADLCSRVSKQKYCDRSHEDSSILVVRCCQMLRALLAEGGTAVRYQIYCAGGLDAVVEALKAFSSNLDVQLEGCQCLVALLETAEEDSFARSASTTNGTIVRNLYRSTQGLTTILGPLWEISAPNTKVWQLFFVITKIVRICIESSQGRVRSEILETLRSFEPDCPMGLLDHPKGGFEKHMQEHLRTILLDEGDYSDANVAARSGQ